MINWHFDWSSLFSGCALLVIGWAMRKLIALCKLAIVEIKSLASVEDVERAIETANSRQLDKLRKEGLLNGVYVKDDPTYKELVENVRKLVRAKRNGLRRKIKLKEPV